MDLHAKKILLQRIPNGLYIVGLKHGKRVHAFSGSWLTQISMKPPMVMLGVRQDSKAFGFVKRGRSISLNFVSKHGKNMIQFFFKPCKAQDNFFGDYAFVKDKTGAPIFKDAIGYLECRVKKVVTRFGDHAAVFAEVTNAKLRSDLEPLILADTPWHYGG